MAVKKEFTDQQLIDLLVWILQTFTDLSLDKCKMLATFIVNLINLF